MWVVLRDITCDEDIIKELPIADLQLKEGHEYIIVDYECVLEPSQFDSITALNEFLQFCVDNDISEDTIAILSKAYFYKEVVESVMSDNYTIINFTDETVGWNYGQGGMYAEEDMGRCLFETGYYRPPFDVPEEAKDWINWSYAWSDASCQGWVDIKYNNKLYLVRKE